VEIGEEEDKESREFLRAKAIPTWEIFATLKNGILDEDFFTVGQHT